MYKYIKVPTEIGVDTILNQKTCLAPSKYHDFRFNKNVEFRLLSSLITQVSAKREIKKSEKYSYIEIGDVDVNSGFVSTKSYYGFSLPSENPLKIESGDILISTVRTYRRGIGMIEKGANNLCATPALFAIRDVSGDVSKEYLLAILRSDFFIEQILSLQNRGMYPRLDGDSVSKVFIPIPKDKRIIDYISVLSRSLVNKYKAIERKSHLIVEEIKNELESKQNDGKFIYDYPHVSEFSQEGRLDAGYFSENHKRLIYQIKKYKNGFFSLDQAGLQLIPGPSLELKLLGTRIDSEVYKSGFYRLVTPKQFSTFGTINYYEFLGTPKKIAPIEW